MHCVNGCCYQNVRRSLLLIFCQHGFIRLSVKESTGTCCCRIGGSSDVTLTCCIIQSVQGQTHCASSCCPINMLPILCCLSVIYFASRKRTQQFFQDVTQKKAAVYIFETTCRDIWFGFE